jgi:hypothetical protein
MISAARNLDSDRVKIGAPHLKKRIANWMVSSDRDSMFMVKGRAGGL